VLLYRLPSSVCLSIAPPHPTSSPCPAGYISWYRNCYKLVEEPATWDAAQKACEQHGANLVSIDMILCDLVLQDDGSFAWTDGWPVFFTQWGPGEPDNLKDEGCVSMRGSPLFHGTWNDTRCDQAKPYICLSQRMVTSLQCPFASSWISFYPF
uniref:C-type lectin domain-containing protein n=1 Tax=Hippocampus comes TaxID=109280 RepID=A0A3Q2YGC3_HIPCM